MAAQDDTAIAERLSKALVGLYERVPLGMRLGLVPMQEACVRAGHPERAFDAVHIAGTNGKGSTSAMVEAMARASGLKTGLFTSPHLCRFAERIRIDGEPITDEGLATVLEEALVVGHDLSFFETATLAAFLAFRAHGVELAVLEVGIGGKLDATNVIPPPRVSVVTRIAFDHMDRLGHTIEAIAGEKAGIAKPGAPIVVGAMPAAARKIIDDAALAAGTHVVPAEGRAASLALVDRVSLGLPGAYQSANVDVALVVAELLGIPEAARARGLATVRWPGRFERIDTPEGPYLLDGAHNPDGAHALAASLGVGAANATPNGSETRMPSGASAGTTAAIENTSKTVLIFGAMADKAWPEVLDTLAPLASERVYLRPSGRAPAPLDELVARHPGAKAANMEDALAKARALAGPEGLVLVTGSLHLVGEARARLLGLPRDPPVAL